ncbi:hypothetical protein B0I33_107273 [Prauserella shujinwangii]|uniref:Uncharacterized protein n=1 Tax=Prauserella shujinwangii TaxID=1453103 RepID=A0A2T0LSR2_9PSEU|nr:hypothetical protein B0I33_107273 [Prauserella shujinwangii]
MCGAAEEGVIEDEVIALIGGIHGEARLSFPWQRADVRRRLPRHPQAGIDRGRFPEEATGRMRPEWTWFAREASRIVARARW